MSTAIILVMDSFGIGYSPDAESFGDVGANTLANLAKAYLDETGNEINLPNLAALGLFDACKGASNISVPHKGGLASKGAHGYAREISTGKDTPSGHWEMAGVPVLFDWGYFLDKENSFPSDLIDKINKATGFDGMLGNCHASGTTILEQLGEEHIKTGLPICYTSGDSVFQIAAHETHFGLDNLYKYCEIVREQLDDLNIGRVIARPFVGETPAEFARTGNRRDYSVLPPAPTVLDKIAEAGTHVISVGKIADIFAHQGISEKTKATGLDALLDASIKHIKTANDNTLIFTNLVNFDQDFGHRRNPVGYAQELEAFDARLPEVYAAMADDDVLLLTADHGCDPTWPGSDHTREYVPVLAYHHNIGAVDLGERKTFADLGQTVAELFNVEDMDYGTSFLTELNFK
ncbi:phosphopentomutase [Psychrosphaera saromensis]|uniref:Phosphopentomutase n=1 Tax=Psychrosphaera saromensis TaxID=716813 RepID=A0A2S7USP5_9GAMM|nr:phosphopentomutase [Psychrosphaera saromensis]PQJ52532.1 phosphopentomutase [Psychrosphaera saromensis]GHB69232.1 phosphopentomutase [Psychrosphaera saromensis]GLQ12996.1 phosphopentomutase [Psychrosphaera saromensis]